MTPVTAGSRDRTEKTTEEDRVATAAMSTATLTIFIIAILIVGVIAWKEFGDRGA